jgi:putative transposase
MIDPNHSLPIIAQAKVLNISRGTVYYRPREISDADLALMRLIDALHTKHPHMGARGLRRELLANGLLAKDGVVGRRHIGTLMRRMGIEAVCPKPGTSKKCPGHTIYPYLLRNRPITYSNDVWAMDTTYIPMREGFVYLTAVIDVHSRAVLAHRVATTLEASVAVEVLQAAYARYGAPNIVNTDQGSQFTAQAFVDAVHAKGCQLSMDGKGAWRDNVFIERFWRTVKYERVYLTVYETVLEAKRDIAQFIDERYNTQRSHSSLEDKTPMSVYWAKLPSLLKKAA